MNLTHNCPICAAPVAHWERYPLQVCDNCMNRAVDENGRRLAFSNTDSAGGFMAFYPANGEAYKSHICYINDLKCRADEHRFGGIVIELVKD